MKRIPRQKQDNVRFKNERVNGFSLMWILIQNLINVYVRISYQNTEENLNILGCTYGCEKTVLLSAIDFPIRKKSTIYKILCVHTYRVAQ